MNKKLKYIFVSILSGSILLYILINISLFLNIENRFGEFIIILTLDLLFLIPFITCLLICFAEKNNRKQIIYNKVFINELTGLPNRTRLIRLLNERSGILFSAILFDINDFRHINNHFGHRVADEIIKKVSEYLDSRLKNGMSLYKFPGDEFFILCNQLKKRLIENFVKKIINEIVQMTYKIDDYEMSVSMRAGIAFKTINYKELFAKVNISCKLAKNEHHGYHIYDSNINLEKRFRKNLECLKTLKEAINSKNIIPFFQPIVDTSTGEIKKYEALARMISSNESVYSAEEFLPVSKTAMLYPVITKQILGKSIKKFKDRTEEISLNFTIKDLKNENIINALVSAVSKYSMEKRVIIEIVENESLSKNKKVLDTIAVLKKNGIKVAIDDFGSGFSNFNYLLQLQADYIKIDGSLIENILEDFQSRIIVESIVSFAHRLGIKVIAEYVKNEKIFKLMKKFNVDYCQGYYCGKARKTIIE